MKKFFIIAALFSISLMTWAQNKEQLLSSISKAESVTKNPKKASNPVSWIKLGDTYMKAYMELLGDGWIGMTKNEAMLLGGAKPLSQETIKVSSGTEYSVNHYEVRDLYFNANGTLDAIIITKPIMEESLLAKAREAYIKAAELDTKGAKTKDIKEKLLVVKGKFVDDAMSHYMLGDVKNAAVNFEESLVCTEHPVVNTMDTIIVYYTAVTYNALGETETAKKYYNKCIESGYYAEGDVYASLAEIAKKEGDMELAKKYLNEAFAKFPSSQTVLISLINIYLDTNDDPQKILQLIRAAQANEPKNASLIYAEGNVYKNLKDYDNAVKCYYKSTEVDPNYIFGIYSVGNTYFDLAIEAQTKMNEVDINDVEGYEKLLAEFEKYLVDSIEPFEKAYAMTKEGKDDELRDAIASALKQIYFRFRDKSPEYQAGYDKYNDYLKGRGIN